MTESIAADPEFDDYDELPVRPRPSYLTPLTAALMALILGGVGFYVGIRVEKSNAAGTAGGGAAPAFGRALSGAAGGGGTGRNSAAGFPGGFGGAGGIAGTVASIDGKTIYVKETGGNTIKVKLSSATSISKSETVSRRKLYPGDQVVVTGRTGTNGAVSATSVTDSGAGSTSSTASATSSSSGSSGGSGSAAISSLFGGG
jgi:hypothetical protein